MRRWYVIVTALVYLISTLPYLYGYQRQDSQRRFTGVVFDVVDTAQYFAWMRSFSHAVLIANPLTPDAGAERFFNLQWWLLGLLAFDTPLGPVWTYQLLRIAALVAFALTLAAFCRIVAPRDTFFAFTVVMLSSGIGWTLVVLKQFTGELYAPLAVQVAEANTFFSAMAFPHLLAAAAMMLAIFVLALRSEHDRRWWRLALIFLLTVALGFSHGYDLIPLAAIPIATTAVLYLRERRIPGLAWPTGAIVAGAALPALYTLSLTRLDESWRGVLAQYGNAGVYTPSPPLLIVLLGLPFLLALWQVRPAAWSSLDTPGLFVRVWLVVGLALAYIPTDYQIKMLTGYQVPIGLLAVETLAALPLANVRFPTLGRFVRAPLTVPLAVLAFIVLTNVYLTAWRVVDLRRADYPYYLAADDVAALESLPGLTQPGQIVLSSPEVGVFVPVYSDARPYVAHWAQTLDFLNRRDGATWFYRMDTNDEQRAEFLRSESVDFVIAGPSEALLAGVAEAPTLPMEALLDGSTVLYSTHPTAGGGP